MQKYLMLGSLAISALLCLFFMITGNEIVLAPALLGLLISFVCAMLFLAKK